MADDDEVILASLGVEDDGSIDQEAAALARIDAMMQDFYAKQQEDIASLQAAEAQYAAQRQSFADAERSAQEEAIQRAQALNDVQQQQAQAEAQNQQAVASFYTAQAEAEAEYARQQQANAQASQQAATDAQDAAQAQEDFASASTEGMNQAQSAAENLDETIKHVTEDTQAAAQATEELSAAARDHAQAELDTSPQLRGYGVSGGMIGPEEEGEDDGSGGGGFGAARAVRGAANLARIAGAGTGVSNAIMGGADVLLMTQGFEKLTDIVPGLTSAVEGLGSQLIGAIPAFEGIGVAGAGMVAVVAPLAALIAATAAGIAIFNEEIKASQQLLNEALVSVDSYFKGIQAGTTQSLQTELAGLESKKSAQDETLAFLQASYDKQKQGLLALEDNAGLAALEHSELADKINKAKDTTKSLAGEMEGLARAMSDTQVIANTAAEQARQLAKDHTAEQQRFEADDAASLKTDQDKLDKLHTGIDTAQANIIVIQKTNDALDKNGEQYLKNQEAIAAYNKIIAENEGEINHIIQVSEVYAQKREALTAADEQYLKSLDDGLAQVKRKADDEQLSAKANEDKTKKLQEDRDATQSAITALEAHGIATDADQKKLDALIGKLEDFDTELGDLHNALQPAVLREVTKAQDDYNKSIEKLQATLKNTLQDLADKERAAEEQYTKGSTQDTYARENIALKEQRDVAKVETETADKIADIHTKLGETETKIEEETSNKIADIRTKLGETEAKTVTDYNRQIYDDQVKAQDAVQKAQIDAQRTSVEETITHQQRLRDLQNQTNASEQQALLDRNFLQLTKLELGKTDQINKENTSYADRESALQRHLANQEADIARNLSITEAAQQTAEGRKIADEIVAADNEIKRAEVDEGRKLAQAETVANQAIEQAKTAEDRKIEAYRTSEQQQLDDLTRNNNEYLTLLRQRYYQEYEMDVVRENQQEQLAAQTEQQIVNASQAILNNGIQSIMAQGATVIQGEMNVLQAQAASAPTPSPVQQYQQSTPTPVPSTAASPGGGFDLWGAISGIGSIFGFAEGGNFQSGQPFVMGEAGAETLNIGANSMGVNAAALVFPLQAGSVDAGSSGKKVNYAPVYNIAQGMEPSAIVRMIEEHNAAFLQELSR